MKTQPHRPLDKAKILKLCKDEKVRFLRLQFTDILGINKNVEVPESQFEKALDGEIMFDGSSIQGFVRIEESDMVLKPDMQSFRIFPWSDERGQVARIICDVVQPNGDPFPGCPRSALKKVVAQAAEMGYRVMLGPEAEFFLFQRNPDGTPTTITHDKGAYFDLAPIDKGEECRRAIVNALEGMGFEIEAAHHEVAPGQHEIDFRYDEAVETADKIATFRFVVRKVAQDFGLHATFMPKPIEGINGSGMHTHQSLFKGSKNAFFDPKAPFGLSKTARCYIAGLMKHAPEITAVCNQWVNSYKRLVPGYEAPVYVSWARRNRSAMIRVPMYKPGKEKATRIEFRSPDPACNPYLAFAVMLAAGLKGIEEQYPAVDPVEEDIYEMDEQARAQAGITSLPGSLYEALQLVEKSALVRETLGEHIFDKFIANKKVEWDRFRTHVSVFEIERYLPLL